jgi:hypothetical protein
MKVTRKLEFFGLPCHLSKQANERNKYLHTVWEGEMAEYDNPDLYLYQ